MAEAELRAEDEAFGLPEWVLEEVSDDARYFNSNLMLRRFNSWRKNGRHAQELHRTEAFV